ncbi:MAG TPA: S53 family peptidase [Candidatus Binataceae bacterium]|nr:S53 family peptidase [Candidatus Binataceae bacterium]
MAKNVLKGSERKPLKAARSLGKADPKERLEVTMLLSRRTSDALSEHIQQLHGTNTRPAPLKREEFARQFGADPEDIAEVRKFAGSHGLAVVDEDAARRTIVLSGTVEQFNKAFQVELEHFEHENGSYRGRTGAIHLPDELTGKVEGVFGLDNRPQAKPHFRARGPHGNVQWHSNSSSFTPTQLASLYNFPAGTGQGECIAIIELGGGYRPADLKKYFAEIKVPLPKVMAVSVDHGKNHPTGDPNGPDGEVMLDIEVAGAIAPAAQIVVYFAPNTDQGFLDAVTTAIHDTTHKPSVVSISWGGPESSWTQQAMTGFDQAFQAAALMGVTVCVAAGDNGSSDGATDGSDNVDFPASSPYALACGGTSVQASANAITSETVWNDGANGGAGGGGISSFFPRPPYQEGLSAALTAGGTKVLTNRGVPDVSADADENTGYDVRVDGTNTVIGGTSAVAPLWAGLIARINQAKGKPVGFIHPLLYKNQPAFNDITQGNNGDFTAAPAWDACTGEGSPNGTKIAAAL